MENGKKIGMRIKEIDEILKEIETKIILKDMGEKLG